MDTEDGKRNEARRVDDPRADMHDRKKADAARTQGPLAHLVDPYDMRAEPQQEEPGYGHGV